jgi:hypothetical protein
MHSKINLFILILVGLISLPVEILAQLSWTPFSGNPVIAPGFDPTSIEIFRPSVIYDGSTYWMWYGNKRQANNLKLDYMSCATSPDGLTWTLVAPVALAPTFNSNSFDQLEASQGWVIVDGNTFKMWYWGFNSTFDQYGLNSIGYAWSADGSTWTRVAGPGRFGSVYDPIMDGLSAGFGLATPCVVKDGNQYHLWYSRVDIVRFLFWIAYATSPDGIHWTNIAGSGTNGAVLDWGKWGDFDEISVSWPAVIKTAQGFEMWYAGVDTTDKISRLGYAISSDGINWTRIRGNGTRGACFDAANFASVIMQGNLYQMWYGIPSQDVVHYATSLRTGVSESGEGKLPIAFALEQNYPNPFNSETVIEYQIPLASIVEIRIFNLLGQKVITIVKDFRTAGAYKITWNGTDEAGLPVASGLYIYQLKAGNYIMSKKMLLLR